MTLKRDIHLFENHPAGVSITNYRGDIIDANQALANIFGFDSKEELLKTHVSELYFEKPDREKVLANLEKGSLKDYQIKGLRKDGSIIWLSISSDPILNDEGMVEYIDIIEDITERINSQEKITRFSKILEESVNEIYVFDAETYKFIELNHAAVINLGYPPKEISGLTLFDINPEVDAQFLNKLLQPIVSGEKGKVVFYTKHQRKNETCYPVEVHLQKSALNNKETFTAIALDISDRVDIKNALISSEEKYKAIVEDQTEYIFRWGPDGARTFVNKAYADYYGQPREKLIGSSIATQLTPDSWKKLSERIQSLTPENPVSTHEHQKVVNGQTFWKEWTDHAFFNDSGEIYEIQSVGRDITIRKNAETKLLENQALLLATLESAGEGILVVDNKGKVTHYNPIFLKMWGIPGNIIETKNDDILLGFVLEQLKYPDLFLEKVQQLYQSKKNDLDIIEFKDGRLFERNSYPLIIGESIEGRVWNFRDVTERYKAEEQIKESEAKFKQLIENLPDAIFVSEIGGEDMGKILDVNRAAEVQTGYSREELLLKKIGEDLLDDFNKDKFIIDEHKLDEDGILRLTEIKRRKDGTLYWVEVIITIVVQRGKKLALSVNRDITELKKSVQELNESRKNLLMIYETAGINLLHIGAEENNNFRVLSVNSMFLQTVGRKREEVENKKIEEVFGKEPSLLARKKFNEAIQNHGTARWEEVGDYPSGKKWGTVLATPVFNENDECIGIIEVIHDITEKKEIEANIIRSQEELENLVQSRTLDLDKSRKAAMNLLQDSNEQRKRAEEAFNKLKESNAEISKLSQVVEQNPAAVVIIGTKGEVEYINHFYTEKTGFTLNEVKGPNPEIRVFSNTLRYERKDIWDVISNGSTWSGEVLNTCKYGDTFWESVSISPLFDESKSIIGFIGVGQDISQRKKLEEDLLVAKEKADEATKTKSEFLANMSHEIRTPMNAILGFADLLSISITDPSAKSYLQSLKTSGKSLLNLINDILDLSKAEAGMLQLNYDFIDLHQLLHEIHEIFSLKLAEKKLNMILEFDPNLPSGIFLDEARLRQVLINLVNNAIKFTETGHIKLTARSDQDFSIPQNKKNFAIGLIIEVEDTGIGIPEEFREIIFDSFTQHEGHDTKKYGGTGLGLAISQKLTRLMGGHITLRSAVGKGTTFTVFLENTMVTTIPVPRKKLELLGLDDIIFDPKTVLIVDDVANNLTFLSGILEHAGLQALAASNGKEAIASIKNSAPDLIITDILMPELDGIELLQFIRESADYRRIPVISSSASAMKESANKLKDYDFDGYLSKPIQIPELLMELKNHISHKIIRSVTKEPLIVDYTINNLQSEKSAIVGRLIEEELMPLWGQIKNRQPVKKVESFGKLLIKTGEKYGLAGFTNYGNDIVDAVKSFNVEGIVRLIRLFPEIIGSIKN